MPDELKTYPRSFRFTGEDLDLMDRLGEGLAVERGVPDVSRTDVIRYALRVLARQVAHPKKKSKEK